MFDVLLGCCCVQLLLLDQLEKYITLLTISQPLNLFSLTSQRLFLLKILYRQKRCRFPSLVPAFTESSGSLSGKEASIFLKKPEKLSAMDVLARASMKDAAKCDTHCELQISVNHQISERIWRCWDFPAARLFQCLLTTPSTPHIMVVSGL